MFERLAVDQAGEWMRFGRHPGRKDAADLVEQPLFELRVHSPRHAVRGIFGRDLQRERHDPVVVQW